jgi:pimeloyl-ACP methyl ester carboxylesterase
MKRYGRIAVRWAAAVALLYAATCGVVAALYRKFLYPVPSRAAAPAPGDAKEIRALAGDGKPVIGFRFGPAPSDHPPLTIVFFHGNGEIAEDNFGLARDLASHGWAVVLPEYRGYGLSRAAGAPREGGLYEDAEAMIDSLGVPSDRIVLMGFSLGTGVCVEMAARGHGHALVLLAPYTSIPDVAARHLPWLPMHWLVSDKLDSESKAAKIALPVLVAQGDRDEVVPFDMGETLAHTFPEGRFVTVSGAHHTDMFATDDHLMQKIVDFLIGVAPSSTP